MQAMNAVRPRKANELFERVPRLDGQARGCHVYDLEVIQ